MGKYALIKGYSIKYLKTLLLSSILYHKNFDGCFSYRVFDPQIEMITTEYISEMERYQLWSLRVRKLIIDWCSIEEVEYNDERKKERERKRKNISSKSQVYLFNAKLMIFCLLIDLLLPGLVLLIE